MNILITGASGFIGSFICERALALGHNVWAGVRKSSSRAYLTDPRLQFAELDLRDKALLISQLTALDVRFDYVVHAAGATKARSAEAFDEANFYGTQRLVEALREANMEPRRLIFVSSLSVLGPALDEAHPQPNTDYARSKLKAEQWLATQTTPYIILRPTGVYGPREKDYFIMASSIKNHIDFGAGFSPQLLTFVYVSDVVEVVFQAIDAPERALGQAYALSDGEEYDSRRFSQLLQEEIGVRRVAHITAPLWFLWLVCALGGWFAKVRGQLTTLNLDKYHLLAQRSWRCSIDPARRDLGYSPQVQLPEGVRRSVAWYKHAGWL